MSKVMEIRSTLMKMRVGEAVRFPTNKPDQFVEIDRVFTGKKQSWVVYVDGERKVMRKIDEVVEVIQKNWNPSLKKIMDEQFSELEEIIDLGEF
ncbi:hypothetical protein MK805_01605 [Shimazuella sp. AN120528]|uniref:hypothetical protein n=1 Tax=Shimazuella soli TaxID=1892854 RepID=UPI001F108738|nr:hypothetical protein [Shimazuella soli]MCH5583667.1 hypothetical protein [Shimazuella soli]